MGEMLENLTNDKAPQCGHIKNKESPSSTSSGNITIQTKEYLSDNNSMPITALCSAEESMLEKCLASQEVAVNELSKVKINLATEQRPTKILTDFSNHSEKVNSTPGLNLRPSESVRSEGNNNAIPASPSEGVAYGFGSMEIIMENDTPSNMDSNAFEKPQRWGWVVVIASWVVMIPISGALSSFGTLVSSLTEEFNSTKFEAGWIGSLSFSFAVGACPLSTPLFTVYGARKVAFMGVIGATISLFVTSFAPTIHLLFFSYSAMLGLFTNFVYNTAMNLTGQYFPRKHQALATCLASAGISFGTLLINPLSSALVATMGWRNTMRVLSAIILVVGIGCVTTFRPFKGREERKATKMHHLAHKRQMKDDDKNPTLQAEMEFSKDSQSIHVVYESRISVAALKIKKNVFDKEVWDCSVCSNPAFILWMVGTLLWSVSFLFPLIFLIDYMTTIGIPRERSAWVMTAYGISEFGGRLLCAIGAGKTKVSLAYIYAISCSIIGGITLIATLGKSLEVMYLYAIVAGVCSGILNALIFVATMQFFGNEKGRHAWGYTNVMLALGMIVGPVAAGGIYDVTQSYVSAYYMGGSVFLVCAVVMCFIPLALKYFSREPETNGLLEKVSVSDVVRGSNSKDKQRNSTVQAEALLKPEQHQSVSKAARKSQQKSKWNDKVEVHLKELHAIQNEMSQ